ncbi:MAG: peptidase M24 [Candidatus Rokubacteria bacterium GWA2_70_23]|nr:MAG: peptidase M24 [Candidatus Rokubacteria bacterium GWA2_70_23]
MKYNVKTARSRWGTAAKDYEMGIDFHRLRQERFQRAQAAVKAAGLGAILCFDMDNIRYITSTTIGEAFRDFLDHYCICPREGKPFLFDPAVPAKRISSPWMEERMEAPITTLKGALPPKTNLPQEFARQIKRVLTDYGVEKEPLGLDICEIPMLRALEKEGITVVDGTQAMLDARQIKTADEIELLKQACSLGDAVHDRCVRAIRPGVKESDLVAIANFEFFRLGADRVPLIQAVTGPRGQPHPHNPSDRLIQPGDMVFYDPVVQFVGYKTCYYRTFICGKPNKYQEEAYETASVWLSKALDVFKPGVTTADVASAWPKAEVFGYNNEAEAFLLQYSHGIGLGSWERPIISRRFSFDHPQKIEEGMVLAVETWCGAADGSGAARIEEMIVVTKDGCELITNYPSDHLISCGIPGCEVFVG